MINLKNLRTEYGLSQQALADKFNLTQQSIYKYEHNLAEPDIKTLKEFADYFDVSIDYLVGYTNERNVAAENLHLSSSEMELIKKFRTLSPELRTSLLYILGHLNNH